MRKLSLILPLALSSCAGPVVMDKVFVRHCIGGVFLFQKNYGKMVESGAFVATIKCVTRVISWMFSVN